MDHSFPSSAPDWCNLKVLHRNTLAPRASFFNYRTVEAALKHDVAASDTYSLNGIWKFHHAPSPFEAPEEFESVAFDASNWKDIQVPSVWQLQGFGHPQYLNKNYGFPVDPPNVPFDENQTGSYIRKFTLPQNFPGSQVRLRFEGVDSGFHCWLNGSEVGYSQGARNPSEFDVTRFLSSGENLLCVRVYQYCDGSYIEDQDQWRLSGIFRDVNLLAFPGSHIEDFRVLTDFDERFIDALLSVEVDVNGPGGVELSLALYDETKKIIVEDSRPVPKSGNKVVFTVPVKSPKHWSAESPSLYHLVLRYGEQILSQRVGFRKVEIKNGLLLVNGKRVVFRGANRHEHHPASGRTVPYEFLRRDLLMMKRHNINAIRTCHQPSDPRLYDLADELGLWILDEADLECHGYETVEARRLSPTERLLTEQEQHDLAFARAGRWLSDNLEWTKAYVDRARQMVTRDKNHPCVVIWSLGNEAFQGRNFQAMYDWVKAYDPSRPIHYEADADARIVDMVSTMYPPLEKMRDFAENWDNKKPLILCEFIHAMGNGPGNIKEYIDLFYAHPCLQGGWVWEWSNHGLLTKTEDGIEYFGYGGDFGEIHHDGHFVMDGVTTSEHQPGPGLLEYQKALEPVQLVPSSTVEVLRIVNRYDFIDLGHLRCTSKIVGDGFAKDCGEISIPPTPAGSTSILSISPLPLSGLPDDKDSYLEVNFTLKDATPWAQRGAEIAWFQIPIKLASNNVSVKESRSNVTIKKTSQNLLQINSGGTQWTFHLAWGRIASWSRGSEPSILHTGPAVSIYRAPADNDVGVGKDWAEKEVKYVRPYTRSVTWSVDAKAGTGQIQCVQHVGPQALEWALKTTTTYTFQGSQVLIHVSGKPKGLNVPRTLPRLGLELSLVPAFDTATWFGRGPGESYNDKKHAQRFGRYSLPIDELAPEYEYPQESGNHTETRWVQFSRSDTGASLKATFVGKPQGFDFQASHYDALDVEKSQHIYELKKHKRDEVIVRLDASHQGLGSESCGPPTLAEYTLKTGPFEFSVLLE
ncbi:Glycoside hydrolase family 2 protein [Pleurostoma richardsiae]|uniref:beta-galactosidase n=1 Tax=Pleurostoma richardsiae TaxID=41990 RepID=A0AA38R0T4_9PEZI|nr:Glycoside hydrolase family 2 protein [Pleurostoma richardsiae]